MAGVVAKRLSNWSKNRSLVSIVLALLIASLIGCAQPPATPTPTQAPKAAPTKEAKPEAKEATPQAKAATPQAKEAKPQATAVAKAATKLAKIKVAYDSVSGAYAPLWITKEKGLFEKYGLDVEVAYIAGGPTVTPAMLAGEISLATQGGMAPINANLAGGDIVIVAGLTNVIGMSIFGQPSIQRIEDFKGKAIGVSRFGTGTDFAARYTLKMFGLTPGQDVAIKESGGTPETLAAMQAGGIQGGVFGPPNSVLAKKAGLREVVNIPDLAIPYAMATIATSKKYMETNQETVRNFVKAMVEGIAVARQDKEFAMKIIGQYIKNEDREVLEETWALYTNKLLPKVPYVDPKAVQTMLDEIALTNPKAKEAKPADFIDSRFVKELDDSGFIKKLYGE
ncbi:MAG: ABC transporter substrate-binding protein [Chloroflexi bacterium]|nr:ABC transporter substrate-binding protein [Chloroflexota bacterium]